MPAMIERIKQPEVKSLTDGGISPNCCGLQPSTRMEVGVASMSSTELNLEIPVAWDSFSDVPSLAEQQEICSAEKALDLSKLWTMAETIFPAPTKLMRLVIVRVFVLGLLNGPGRSG